METTREQDYLELVKISEKKRITRADWKKLFDALERSTAQLIKTMDEAHLQMQKDFAERSW